MEVILLERVAKLGQMGDVVSVKDGFARNFLLPQKKALRATEANKAAFEADRARLEAENLERKTEAEAVAAKIADLKVIMIRSAGESGQLYGSVSSRDIAEAVAEAGVKVSRNQVVLDRAIKTLGLHDVVLSLHPEVSVTVVVNIARSAEEAEMQFETGAAVTSNTEEEDFDAEAEFAAEEETEVSEETAEEAAEEEATEE
ncbi:50S ribosomal protein L9 [Kordiimonas sp. SCSIO 12603]|uniref:50S ribosomal protein L9 n=1 Tax=Kordiimonas sp. SCSIO 12603 TaxID=2829596 RepID=UPI002105EEAA|nr:50S ribosomal protein L9 [Kordiimonas sp. SCSIO 12603]UTW57336.1 50S ribosomal protein L9 [Kordiimonas sp. SCSIO 12603]